MSIRAKAIATLYRANRLTKQGVKLAVQQGVITAEEYAMITGEVYQ